LPDDRRHSIYLCSKPRGGLPAPGKCMTGKNDVFLANDIEGDEKKKYLILLYIFMHHVYNNMRKP